MTALLIALDLALLLGFTLRLVRFVLTDDLGQMWVQEPAARVQKRLRQRAVQAEYAARTTASVKDNVHFSRVARRSHLAVRYLDGLSCPFCVGFWLGVLATASLVLVWAIDGTGSSTGWAINSWRFLAGVFTLNWLAAHLGVRAGDAGYADDDDEES